MLGCNPLNVLITSSDWITAVESIQSRPELANYWTTNPAFFGDCKHRPSNLLPIHHTWCANNVPFKFLKALVSVDPKVSKKTYLLTCHPRGASMIDAASRLPLHYPCSNEAPLKVVEALSNTCPGGPRARDRKVRLPLHIAANADAPSFRPRWIRTPSRWFFARPCETRQTCDEYKSKSAIRSLFEKGDEKFPYSLLSTGTATASTSAFLCSFFASREIHPRY